MAQPGKALVTVVACALLVGNLPLFLIRGSASVNGSGAGLQATYGEIPLLSATTGPEAGSHSDNPALPVAVVASVAVTPVDPTVETSKTLEFRAMAMKSNGTKVDATASAIWTSSNNTVATITLINGKAIATAVAAGTTNVTANVTSGGVTGLASSTLTVTTSHLISIAVIPANAAAAAGETQQFIATGNYSGILVDLTGSANWTSSNATVARIVAGGLATTYAVGSANISAAFDGVSGNTNLTVTEKKLALVTVTPVSPAVTFVSGNRPTLPFMATAVLSDGSTSDATGSANWTSTDPDVASIGLNTGLATTNNTGTATITASVVIGGVNKTGASTLTVLPDTVAPVVNLTSPPDGMVTGNSTLTVFGSIIGFPTSANLTVNRGAPIPLVLVGGKFTTTANLSAGANKILVEAADEAGNVGSTGTTVRLDSRKPNIIIISPAEGAVTNNATIAITGTVFNADNGSIKVIVNGDVVASGLGTGSFTANATLSKGRNNIIASGYGTGGNNTAPYHGTSGARTVILDTTAPVVTITSPASGAFFNTPGIVVEGTVDDPAVDNVTMRVNDVSQNLTQIVPVRGGRFSQEIKLAAGSNNVTAQATDAANNQSAAASVTVTFDSARTQITVTSPANNLFTSSSTILLAGNVSDPSARWAWWTVVNSATSDSTVGRQFDVAPDGSFATMVDLVPGLNVIQVTTMGGGESGLIKVTLDTTPPSLTIGLTDPSDSLRIKVTSNEALGAAPAASVNGTDVVMTPNGANNWIGDFQIPAPGSYAVTANTADMAGNAANQTAVFATQDVDIAANAPKQLVSGTTTLTVTSTENLTEQSVTVTQHKEDPAENTRNKNPNADKSAGLFVEINASANLTSSDLSVEIRVNYDPAAISALNIDENTLKLYLLDQVTGQWEPVSGGSGVNIGQHYVYGTTHHLSKYGTFGKTKTVTTSPAPAPAQGGGGGGGGGAITLPTPGLTGTVHIDPTGTVVSSAVLTSGDTKASLNLPAGTRVLDKDGLAATTITASAVTPSGAAPGGKAILSAFEFGPDGTTFSQMVTLSMTYDASSLPAGANETDLVIAWWDGSRWVSLTGTVDTTAKTVKAQTNHFTQFALISSAAAPVIVPIMQNIALPVTGPPAPTPAAFTTSMLAITPSTVYAGENVDISVLVANNGKLSGTYKVTLLINGAIVASKDVTLDGGATQRVNFAASENTAGSYAVAIDTLTAVFTVNAAVAPIARSLQATTQPLIPVRSPPRSNAWLLWVVAAVVLAAAIAAAIMVRSRRAAMRQANTTE